MPGTEDTVHQCSGSIEHEGPHYCGCGHEWNDAGELVMLPRDWEEREGVHILDADGWGKIRRYPFPRAWNVPITREEFQARAIMSTCEHPKR